MKDRMQTLATIYRAFVKREAAGGEEARRVGAITARKAAAAAQPTPHTHKSPATNTNEEGRSFLAFLGLNIGLQHRVDPGLIPSAFALEEMHRSARLPNPFGHRIGEAYRKIDLSDIVHTPVFMKKVIRWNPEKADLLSANKTRGGFSFEDCVIAIEGNGLLDIIQNPSSNHPDQRIYGLNLEGYVYLVPFVETADDIFLKTMVPSRKYTALYLGERRL